MNRVSRREPTVPGAGLEPARACAPRILRADPAPTAAEALDEESASIADKSQSEETVGDHD